MSDSLISVAPGLDEPLEILSACHTRVLAQLETLDRLVRWLPDHGADADARKAAANVIRYFSTAALNHHRDEEEDVFPLMLERCTPSARSRIRRLINWALEDHRALEAAWVQLRESLEVIAAGTGVSLSTDDVTNFTTRYLNHIDREDNELFPYAANVFTEMDLRALSTHMTQRRTAEAAH